METNRTVIGGHEGGSWNYSQEYVTGDGYVVRFPSERVDVQGRTNRFVYATNQFVLQLDQYTLTARAGQTICAIRTPISPMT